MARRSETRRRHGRHRSYARENRRTGYSQAVGLSYIGTGDGSLSGLGVDPAAPVESWTITMTAATTFTATGSVSGLQVATGTVGVQYTSDSSEITLLLTAGGVAFIATDEFTFDADVSPGYQANLERSRSSEFIAEQNTRLTPNEGEAGIHGTMHLVQGEDESFTSEQVIEAAAATDVGLT